MLDKAKSEYEQVKKIVNELRASEVTKLVHQFWQLSLSLSLTHIHTGAQLRQLFVILFRLMLNTNCKTWRKCVRGWSWRERITRKSLMICKCLWQNTWNSKLVHTKAVPGLFSGVFWIFLTEFLICGSRIRKDLVDPEKLQANLTDKSLTEACDLRRALEMVALLEAQLKEMSPNLDSISE